jgi:hypothetical protein
MLAPDRRIGIVQPITPPAAKPVVAAPFAPGQPAPVPGERPVPTAGAPPPAAPNLTPAERALAVDLRYVQPFVGASKLGPLVNENDPVEAVTRVMLPNGVDQNNQLDPEFAEKVARAIANDYDTGQMYLDPVAQMAWYRDRAFKGEPLDAPENAPGDYLARWKETWRGGRKPGALGPRRR